MTCGSARVTERQRPVANYETIAKLIGSSQKARHARILRQVDADGPDWTDRQVAAAYRCRVQTVENTRRRCVLKGFKQVLHGHQQTAPPAPKLLDGELHTIMAMLRDHRPYIDPGIDYDKLLVDRNAARWLRKLKEHGYLQKIRSGSEPAAA